jgi:glycosyltransferase involved in cell wall biosynthesis
VIERLQQADVFCFPTAASEGFPKAVLEAMACGLPVVSTRVSVLGQLVGAGGGTLIDAAEPEPLAAARLSILEDDARSCAMSVSAIDIARAYSLERWSDAIRVRLTHAWGALRSHA